MLWGAVLGRAVIYVNNVSGLEWKPCPDPPEVHGSLPVDGHETKLGGGAARLTVVLAGASPVGAIPHLAP
jgi:hypothetical protein